MDLYLAVVLPEGEKAGKRVRLRDKWQDKVDYKNSFVLYPTKATKVPDDVAEKLLEQDPHLVSTKPFKETTESTEITKEEKKEINNSEPLDYEPILAVWQRWILRR